MRVLSRGGICSDIFKSFPLVRLRRSKAESWENGERDRHWDYLGEGGVTGWVVAEEEPGQGRIVFCLRWNHQIGCGLGVHPCVLKLTSQGKKCDPFFVKHIEKNLCTCVCTWLLVSRRVESAQRIIYCSDFRQGFSCLICELGTWPFLGNVSSALGLQLLRPCPLSPVLGHPRPSLLPCLC